MKGDGASEASAGGLLRYCAVAVAEALVIVPRANVVSERAKEPPEGGDEGF